MGSLIPIGRLVRCSRCGVIDEQWAWYSKRGMLCGMPIAYDVMSGTTFCRRKLKPVEPPEVEQNENPAG